jgi:hypothetical protein
VDDPAPVTGNDNDEDAAVGDGDIDDAAGDAR